MKKRTLLIIFAFILTLTQNLKAQTIILGKQVWSTKNLSLTIFRNGDSIQQAKTNEEWETAITNKQPAWCYYGNSSVNGSKYGIIYNWYAVIDPRGLAPTGYHIPSEIEWRELAVFLGGESIAGKKMKSTSGWKINGNGTNSTGFLGTPGGCRFSDGTFEYLGAFVTFFSTTVSVSGDIVCSSLGCDNDFLDISDKPMDSGYYVRCLKD